MSAPELSRPAPSTAGAIRPSVEIRAAGAADNRGLLALTRATPMPGAISVRIDREPDFFALLRLRGDSKVFVAATGAAVVGCISVTTRAAFVSGRVETVGYVGDLKVDPRWARTGLVPRLVRAAADHLRSSGVDLVLSVVAGGNIRALSLFKAGLGNPRSRAAGQFLVDELIAWPFKPRQGAYRVEPASVADGPAIAELLARCHRARQFSPARAELAPALAPSSRTYVARDAQRLVATLTLFDPRGVKANILVAAPLGLRLALALLRGLRFALPRLTLPRVGQAVPMLYARHVACADTHGAALHALLGVARAEAFRQGCSFVAVGLHERDPLREAVRGLPRFTFTSQAFVVSLDGGERLDRIASGIPFEDFSLV